MDIAIIQNRSPISKDRAKSITLIVGLPTYAINQTSHIKKQNKHLMR